MKFENIDKKPDKINGIHLFSKPLKTCPVEYFKIPNNFSELKNESDKRAARINLGVLWEAIEGDILANPDLQNALSIYLRKVEAAILNEDDLPTSNRENITYKKTDSNFLTNSNVYKTFSLIDKNILSNGQVAWFRMAYCPPNSSSNSNGSISFLYCLNNSLTEPSETDWENIQNLNNIDTNKLLYKTNIVNNVTTSTNGYVLDARIGKSLNDKITSLNSTLDSKINDVNSTLDKKINDNTQEILYTQELIDRVEESINQRITNLGSVYSVQGSVSNLNALLKLSSAQKGYTYNIESGFYLNSKYYEAGTNVVCIKAFSSASDNKDSCWDPLGGTFNTSFYLEKDKAAIANKPDLTAGVDRMADVSYIERDKGYISGGALGSTLPFKILSKTTLDNGDTAWYRLAFNYPTGSSNGAQQLLLQYAVTSNQSEPSTWTTIDYVNDIKLKDIGSLKQSVNNLTKNLQLNYYSQDDINTIVQELSDSISDLLSELDDAKDIVVYQIPSDFFSVEGERVEKEITADVFQSIFGNIDEFINNVKTKHIRLGIPNVLSEDKDVIYIDVTSSLYIKEEVVSVINIAGSWSLGTYTMSVNLEIGIDGTDVGGIWGTWREITPEEMKDDIIYNWDDFDFSVKKGIVSQEVYDNLLKADIITTHGVVFNAKMVEGNSIILVFYNYNYGFIEENKLLYDANIITVNKDLNYTAELFSYDLPNTDFVFQELIKKQDVLNISRIFNSYSWEDKGTLTPQTLLVLFLNAEVGYYQFRINYRTYRMIKHQTAQEGEYNTYLALDITGNPTWGYIQTDGYLGHWSFNQNLEPKIEDLISYQQIINETQLNNVIYVWENFRGGNGTVTKEQYISLQEADIVYLDQVCCYRIFKGGDRVVLNTLTTSDYGILDSTIQIMSNLSYTTVDKLISSSSKIAGLLNIKDSSAITQAQNLLTEDRQTATYIITDHDGNYPSPNVPLIYLDNMTQLRDLLYKGNGNALAYLLDTKEAYYQYGGTWYSQNIAGQVKLPTFNLTTARVGDLVTLIRYEFTADEFYNKYINFSEISNDNLLFKAYKLAQGYGDKTDGEFIQYLIRSGAIYSCPNNPEEDSSVTPVPLAVNEKVVLYTAQITPNTQHVYSGEFWSGNITAPGIYCYVTSGRPEGTAENFIGVVSKDGTKMLLSMKNPSNNYILRNGNWQWIGVGKNAEGTGELFNDYINNFAHSDHGHAEGQKTYASWNSHAEGFTTTAGSDSTGNAHAEGNTTKATGNNSHAEGINTIASGHNSHAEGDSTQATNWNSHAEGYRTHATGNGAHAEGNSDGIDDETRQNVASGFASHVEGCGTVASGTQSHAEGYLTLALGKSSHAEGAETKAFEPNSHAEGKSTQASGECSHAEGSETRATNFASHAEGIGTQAHGAGSHAEGCGTFARSIDGCHAEGKYNFTDHKFIHAVGIGTSDIDRKDAHTITLDGKHYIYNVGGYNGTNISKSKDLASVINSFSSIIDKGTLDNQGMVALCESDELGIFTCVDSRNRYTIIKPYVPTGTYQFFCIIDYPDGTNDLGKFGGDNHSHGGVVSFIDTTVTQDSTKPISSGAVYNAIYSVLNTEV